jgi:heptosyltransferase-3
MNIVVIRPGAIGDVLLTFPILQALRAKYSSPYITFVSNASVLPLAQASGLVDEVSDYQDMLWSELFSTKGIHTPVLKSRLQAVDMAICWLGDVEGIVERNLHSIGIRQIIIAPGRPPQGERIHIVDYLAKTVGVEVDIHKLAYSILGGKRGTAGDIGVRAGAADEVGWRPLRSPSSQNVAIHPGSGGAQKCWPIASFASVIERLWERSRPVLLLAGPAEAERLAYLRRHLATPPAGRPADMFRVLFNAPLLEVARNLQQCKAYLGNDSGITHLAAMLGVPTVAIFGPSDPVIWRPVGDQVCVIHEPELENLPVDVVIEALTSFYEV